MSDDKTTPHLPPDEIQRVWRTVTVAGAVGIIYYAFCILEVPKTRFLLELGATPFHFGLIASLASLAIGFQLLSGIWAQRLSRRKPAFITLFIASRLLFFAVLAAPMLFSDVHWRLAFIIGVFFIHDALFHMAAPLWLSWTADILPPESVNSMWARRQGVVTAVYIVAMVVAAVVMGWFERRDQIILGFVLLATAGIAAGVADLIIHASVPDPPRDPKPGPGLLKTLAEPLKDRQYRPFLLFMVYWHFTMMLGAPFFTPYLVDSLKLSSFTAQMVIAMSPLGVVLSSTVWGLVCDTFGNRPVLQIVLWGKVFTILSFVFAPPVAAVCVPFLGLSLLLDGVFNAGLLLAMNGIMFHSTPRENRTMYIASVNFIAVGVAGGLAPLLSGTLIDRIGDWNWPLGVYRLNAYHVVFIVSVVSRLGAIWFAARVPSRKHVPMRTALAHLIQTGLIPVLWNLRRLRKSPSETARLAAARRLGALRTPLAINGLIEALKDGSRDVRQAAANALGRIGQGDAVAPLAKALGDPDAGIHSAIAVALGRIGGFDSLKALLANLRGMDRRSLLGAIRSLERIGDEAALLPLICLLEETSDEGIRHRIAQALDHISKANAPQEIQAIFGSERRHGLRV